MDMYFSSNRDLWNQWTKVHVGSKFYDVDGFKAGRNTLKSVELDALGDVRGKSLLHLQCHFGMDTLSWARLGATVTGVDFSEEAIITARELSCDVGVPAEFLCSNIYDLPSALDRQFDIVFTSYGTVYWLPDVTRWAEIVSQFLKPGGTFFVADSHPFAMVFENEGNIKGFDVHYPYFHSVEPIRWETNGSYADPSADVHGVEYGWQHSLGDIMNSLIRAGFRIEELGEYPFVCWQMFPFMEERSDGWWHLPDGYVQVPLMFSLKATRIG